MSRTYEQHPIHTPVSLDWLRDQIAAREERHVEDGPGVATGWGPVDQALGGLRQGATHEWFTRPVEGLGETWTPPLMVLSYLCSQALRAMPEAWVLCVGRRVWPSPLRLLNSHGAVGGCHGHVFMPMTDAPRTLDHAHAKPWACHPSEDARRWLMVDVARAEERIWAIDAGLRCGGMIVLADGSGLDTAATRRLQLAAEAGGSLGLIARPPRERDRISIAETRWEVSPAISPNECARWVLRVMRSRGSAAACPQVLVECGHDGSVVCVPEQVGQRPGAPKAQHRAGAGDHPRAGRTSA